MLRRARSLAEHTGRSGVAKKKPAPKRGLKVLKEDVVGTYAAGAHPLGTVPRTVGDQAAGPRSVYS